MKRLSRDGTSALIRSGYAMSEESGRSLSGFSVLMRDARIAAEAGRDRYLEDYADRSDALQRADRGQPQPGLEADIAALNTWRDLCRALERAESLADRLSMIHFQGGIDRSPIPGETNRN